MIGVSKEKESKKRFSIRKSVKAKLILGMMAIAIIPTVILSTITMVYTKDVLEEEVTASSIQLSEQINNSIDNYMLSLKSQLNATSKNINFQEFYANEMNSFYGSEILKGIQESHKDYGHVYFASTKKDLVIQPESKMSNDFDPTTRDWYKNAVQANGEFVVNDPYEDTITKEMIVTMSQSVIHNGEVVGVVGMDLNLKSFSEEINKIVIGEKGYAFILSSKGIAISHNDQSVIGTDSQTKLTLWDDISSKEEGISEYEFDGIEKLSAFDTNETTGWKIISTLDKKEIDSRTDGIALLSIVLVIVSAIIASIIAYLFGRNIANNLSLVKSAFKQASEGDLTTRISVKAKDEFKELEHSFNDMMHNLSATLEDVQNSSKKVLETSAFLTVMTAETSASSLEVARAIEEIASGTSSQAENAHASSEEMSNLSDRLDHILLSTNDVNQTSKRSEKLSIKGLHQVDVLIEKSSHTKNSTVKVGEIINEVDSKVGEINKIIETIKTITEQTNLLSLNASIESARAGEHGKGFAVVANEVRNLAEQSKASATEIMKIVDNIKEVVNQAVLGMKQTQVVVAEQDIAVEETKLIFTDILNAINEVSKKSEEVNESVLESQRNKESVLEEIENISAVSQQTASTAEEVSASAEEISATMEEFSQHVMGLEQLAKHLESDIENFKIV